MMNNNKILTVSYGAFSCTLEGFEDSFGTMKAIAEYFRDLAADDRYFGAEPPQPDAEMLARIAQKEVSRRVEAREQDGKIVLSALEDGTQTDAPTTPALAATALSATPAVIEEVSTTPDVIADFDDAEVPQADTPVISIVHDADDSDDQEAGADDIVIAEDPETEEPVAAELSDADKDSVLAAIAGVSGSDAPSEEDVDIVPGQPDAEVEAFFSGDDAEADDDESAELDDADAEVLADDADEAEVEEVEEAEAAEVDIAEVEEDEPAPAPDSIAAKLQRIRAVVAQQEVGEDEDDYLEDEHAGEAEDPETAELIAEARADIEEALEADDVQDAEEVEAEDRNVSDILKGLETVDDADEAAELEEVDLEAVADDALEEDGGEDTVNNLFDEDDSSLASDDAEDDAEETLATAQVIKVKRADLEAALESGALEEVEDEDDAEKLRALDDLAPAKGSETSLTPEDEADLTRELADLADDIAAEAETDDEAAAEEEIHGSAKLPSIDEGEGADVSRLLAETDHQMDEPEGATRRDAFAHLRAAVAAKKADASIDEDEAAREGHAAYRDDLAEVVRPRRPVSTTSRSERPDDARPAPLKLVAEQRIDVETPKSAGPVRPRRVSAVADTPSDTVDGESFADFAEEMGATSLPQLLEAAAAYLSFVEGREQFSRPQLMTKVRQAGGQDGFSREEGLRSFGQLLRSGKIEKIKGGRFTVSEDIGYRPDQRAAG